MLEQSALVRRPIRTIALGVLLAQMVTVLVVMAIMALASATGLDKPGISDAEFERVRESINARTDELAY